MSRRVSRNDYNFRARLLHRFALAWPGIARASFDFERSLAKAEQPAEKRHVFVAGLAEAFPFRNLLQQADSLLIKHRRFVARHNKDRFGSAYMRWLGHHEFGVNHRPFRFSETSELASIKADSDSPEYWLKIWLETYTHIFHNRPTRSLLVCYEDLCNNPDAHLRRIHTEVYLRYSCNDTGVEIAEARRNVVSNVEAGLKDRALSLYGALRKQSDF